MVVSSLFGGGSNLALYFAYSSCDKIAFQKSLNQPTRTPGANGRRVSFAPSSSACVCWGRVGNCCAAAAEDAWFWHLLGLKVGFVGGDLCGVLPVGPTTEAV